MKDGIGFLRRVSQEYIQYDVERPIQVSREVFGNPDEVIIHQGWAPTIDIGTRSSFEIFKKVNGDSDYRASDAYIIATLTDPDKIAALKSVLIHYYVDKDYVQAIENMINVIEPQQTLKFDNKGSNKYN